MAVLTQLAYLTLIWGWLGIFCVAYEAVRTNTSHKNRTFNAMRLVVNVPLLVASCYLAIVSDGVIGRWLFIILALFYLRTTAVSAIYYRGALRSAKIYKTSVKS